MVDRLAVVTGGVDTHLDIHVAVVVDEVGRMLGTKEFTAEIAGYRALLRWMRSFGALAKVGAEGTGAYGAGLARYLAGESVAVVEVIRPNRQTRRRRGKSDPADAEVAARAALIGERRGLPRPESAQSVPVHVVRLGTSLPSLLSGFRPGIRTVPAGPAASALRMQQVCDPIHSLAINDVIHYFDGVNVEDCSRAVADEAAARARAALLRRRPDLPSRAGHGAAVPGDEEAQVVLDTLAFFREVADRLHADMAAHVLEARRRGASWARIGIALQQSPQTAFNRYRHLEQPPARRDGQRTSVSAALPRRSSGAARR